MQLIVRTERPCLGAQLCFTDADGMRLTCFATNTKNVSYLPVPTSSDTPTGAVEPGAHPARELASTPQLPTSKREMSVNKLTDISRKIEAKDEAM
jgi:hypothetical protein